MSRYQRVKEHKDKNYIGVFNDGRTIRLTPNPNKSVAPLPYPEIEDVAFNDKCLAACPYCYTSALKTGSNFDNIVGKIYDYYGNLTENDRPFQVAIGGAGEPTMHPDFCEALEAFSNLNIMPNYTTNGMHLSEKVLEATKKYSGGVAVSCHPHIEKIWRKAVALVQSTGIRTCVHIIVGEPGTSDKFWEIYDSLDNIHYYVALPYMAVGRAKEIEVEEEWGKFFTELAKRGCTDLAFGALFYPYLLKNPKLVQQAKIDLYEPEVLSGYRLLNDNYKTLLKSSYDLIPKIANG